jgi:Tol biopolymer transport system component
VWSPDGDEIAFGSDEGGQNQVWRVSAGGGPVRPFTKTQLSESRLLAWAPGRAILYHWPGNRNFHLLDPVTEEERPLVRNEHVGWMFFPRYDPNGRRIAVNWNRKDGRGIWVISLDDGSQRLVRKLADGFRTASWSADGTALYLIETQKGGKVLLRVAVRGGEPKIVAVLPIEKPVQEEIVSPDGRRIICAVVESVSDVWMVEHFDPDLR